MTQERWDLSDAGRPGPKLLTPEQAAEWLHVPVRMVRRLRFEQKLPCVKVGRYVRFRPEDLQAYCDAQVVVDPRRSLDGRSSSLVSSKRANGPRRKGAV